MVSPLRRVFLLTIIKCFVGYIQRAPPQLFTCRCDQTSLHDVCDVISFISFCFTSRLDEVFLENAIPLRRYLLLAGSSTPLAQNEDWLPQRQVVNSSLNIWYLSDSYYFL